MIRESFLGKYVCIFIGSVQLERTALVVAFKWVEIGLRVIPEFA
jgi:hypothetical protein